MTEENFFDRARIDVLSTANDHVFLAADYSKIPLVIERSEVTAVEPAGSIPNRLGAFRIVQKAVAFVCAAPADLTDFIAFDGVAGLVLDDDLLAKQRATGGL